MDFPVGSLTVQEHSLDTVLMRSCRKAERLTLGPHPV
jgi:hypothetical protein